VISVQVQLRPEHRQRDIDNGCVEDDEKLRERKNGEGKPAVGAPAGHPWLRGGGSMI